MFHNRLSVVFLIVLLCWTLSGFSEARSRHSHKHHRTSEEDESTSSYESSEERPRHTGSRKGHRDHQGRSIVPDRPSMLGGLGSTLGSLLGISENSKMAIQKGTDILADNAGSVLYNLFENALGSGQGALVTKAKETLSGLAQQAVNAGSTMIADKGQELLSMAASAATNKAYAFGKDVIENKASDLIGDLAATAMRTNPDALLSKGDSLLQSMMSMGIINPTGKSGSSASLGDIARIITNVVSL